MKGLKRLSIEFLNYKCKIIWSSVNKILRQDNETIINKLKNNQVVTIINYENT